MNKLVTGLTRNLAQPVVNKQSYCAYQSTSASLRSENFVGALAIGFQVGDRFSSFASGFRFPLGVSDPKAWPIPYKCRVYVIPNLVKAIPVWSLIGSTRYFEEYRENS